MGKLGLGLAIVGGTIVLIPPFRRHFDHKIWKHFRNYNTTLSQRNRFNTEEEFHDFLCNVGNGVITFFDTKYWSNSQYPIIPSSINTYQSFLGSTEDPYHSPPFICPSKVFWNPSCHAEKILLLMAYQQEKIPLKCHRLRIPLKTLFWIQIHTCTPTISVFFKSS